MRGVTLDWIYREEVYPNPGLKYPSIAAELKATLLLEGAHFEEDSRAVYNVVASSTLGTSAYAYIKKIREVQERPTGLACFEATVWRGGLRFVQLQRCQ
jgi:hypothetical protein